MKLTHAKLINFRNYDLLDLNINHMVNVIYGDNAQGKTNFLEGIYFAAFGFPCRTKNDEELVKFGNSGFATEVEYSNNFGKNKILVKKYEEKGRKKKVISYNENTLTPKEHYGLLNVVLFSPDDLQMVKGEPGLRRKFLDMEIAQINKYYYQLLVKYNKLLAQRNKFLKLHKEASSINQEEISIWDMELAKVAAEIYKLRQENIKSINLITSDIYYRLTGERENLALTYILKTAADGANISISENIEEFYLNELKKRQKLDLLRGYTSIGPHRDDLLLQVEGNNLRNFGSQGQQRSAALALKLAELEFIKNVKEEYPILLLDDVMSELDENRRSQLLKFIDGRVQTFVTLNDKKLVENLVESKFYRVDKGNMKEE